jgi:hypothetical protein
LRYIFGFIYTMVDHQVVKKQESKWRKRWEEYAWDPEAVFGKPHSALSQKLMRGNGEVAAAVLADADPEYWALTRSFIDLLVFWSGFMNPGLAKKKVTALFPMMLAKCVLIGDLEDLDFEEVEPSGLCAAPRNFSKEL